jgi:hypothetical protein
MSTGYTLDRWQFAVAGDTASVSAAAMTDGTRAAIGDEAGRNALGNAFTGNAAATSYTFISQPIEDARRLSGKTVTVSFWAAAIAGTPKLGISLDQVFGSGGSPSVVVNGNGVAINLEPRHGRVTNDTTVPSTAGKTFGTNNDSSTWFNLWFSAGTNFTTRTGNIGVQAATIYMWGVQLEIGSTATPLEKPDPRYDLANCQRFYQVTTVHSTFVSAGGSDYFSASGSLPVQMRATPTLTSAVQVADALVSGFVLDNIFVNSFRAWAYTSGAGLASFDRYVYCLADL